MNSATPARKMRRRPTRSPRRPASSSRPPNAIRYAFTTHARLEVEKCRSSWIDGQRDVHDRHVEDDHQHPHAQHVQGQPARAVAPPSGRPARARAARCRRAGARAHTAGPLRQRLAELVEQLPGSVLALLGRVARRRGTRPARCSAGASRRRPRASSTVVTDTDHPLVVAVHVVRVDDPLVRDDVFVERVVAVDRSSPAVGDEVLAAADAEVELVLLLAAGGPNHGPSRSDPPTPRTRAPGVRRSCARSRTSSGSPIACSSLSPCL